MLASDAAAPVHCTSGARWKRTSLRPFSASSASAFPRRSRTYLLASRLTSSCRGHFRTCASLRRSESLTSGECAWDARRLPELEHSRRSFITAFPDPEDEYGRVWRDKLPLFGIDNGDMVAVDRSRPDTAPVVYLSHAGSEAHDRVLGYSCVDFIDRWTLLGCVGPEDSHMAPFLHPDRPYLDPIGDPARSWRAWFGVDVLAAV
jgi:hypothetical protein